MYWLAVGHAAHLRHDHNQRRLPHQNTFATHVGPAPAAHRAQLKLKQQWCSADHAHHTHTSAGDVWLTALPR
jgi:hypothetical protein